MTAQPPLPNKWTKFLTDIYVQGQSPVLGTVSIKEIEDKAREFMTNHIGEFPCSDNNQLDCWTRFRTESGVHVYLWKCWDVLDGHGEQEGDR
ncbi:hypothetical protein BDN67DRAFT_376589 [Paxillus ammoniavirescens]|nr:hypothetical protein BDN67DRAFT_376589 [Paxillus ammoniavirescens]